MIFLSISRFSTIKIEILVGEIFCCIILIFQLRMEIKSFFYKFKKFLIILFSFVFLNILNLSAISSSEETKETKNYFFQKNVYLLGPGDVINVNTIDVPELSRDLEILPDGTIFLPLVGSVNVKDLSIDDAKELIQKKLSDHLLVPEVQLSLINLKPIRVTLIESFKNPGIYLFDKDIGVQMQSLQPWLMRLGMQVA